MYKLLNWGVESHLSLEEIEFNKNLGKHALITRYTFIKQLHHKKIIVCTNGLFSFKKTIIYLVINKNYEPMKKIVYLLAFCGIGMIAVTSCGKPYECVCHEGEENEYTKEISANNRTDAEFECGTYSKDNYNSIFTCDLK
ncbi:MAG: hypothetical protein JJU02_03210 [Cryomorphaceae bacterium]|nr:hypothetical protein [Cryomorphaceae bacterium]